MRDMQKVEELAFRVVSDGGGAFTVGLAYIGDRLGIFKAMKGVGMLTSMELARKTGLNERYVREWLRAMVAAEYLDYDTASGKYLMTEEQAMVLADEESPAFVGGALHMSIPTLLNVPRLMEIFKTGGGIPYSEIGEEIPEAIERFFRPGYRHQLNQKWLPAVPGLVDRLKAGALIGDVGCGCGQSSAALAQAYPKSTVIGIDNDAKSIERAKSLAFSQGLKNVEFLTIPADKIPRGKKFDLVCAFDCIHDMVDPKATLKAIRESLSDDGVFLWLEPNASENPLENRNPVGKIFSTISPLHCMTVSLAHGGEGLGTVIGETGARSLARDAGFSRFEKASIEDPFNQFFILEK